MTPFLNKPSLSKFFRQRAIYDAKSSEPSKHLRSNINHYFTWAVISNAPKIAKTRKNLKASYIAFWKPDLNEQKDFERLVLFRNGVK